MPTSEDATMAEPGDIASRFRLAPLTKKTKKAKDVVETEGEVQHTFKYPMRILMPVSKPGTKSTSKATYNPIPKTKTLMMTLAEIDHGLAVTSIDGKSTLTIKEETFPKTEEQFKKFFTYEWEPNGPHKGSRVRLGCTVNGNQTLNQMKHTIKPNRLIQWLRQEKVFLEADTLGIGKTKTVGYLMNIHPRIINRTSTKEKLHDTLNATIINPEEVAKLDNTLHDLVSNMNETGDDPIIHCPAFELFQTTIGIGNNPRVETDVLGIKCQAGKAALIREFLIQTSSQIEKQGLGKFIPAGLANVIGTETMTTIIRNNNQYLKSLTTIPINGIPNLTLQTEIIIDDDLPEAEKVPIKVQDYLLSAEWCHGIEPTDRTGRYLLITTYQQIAEAREWLDENLEKLFIEYLPEYGTFTPIEGYTFPKRGDIPRFSHQLGTYADQIRKQYTPNPQEDQSANKQWNRPPINRYATKRSFNFDEETHPELPKKTKNQPTKTPQHTTSPNQPIPNVTQPPINAKDLREKIMADMQNDLTKMISKEMTTIRTELKDQITDLSNSLKKEMNTQIADVLLTIDALNQRFNEVMDRLPPNPNSTPAHKKSKGLGAIN